MTFLALWRKTAKKYLKNRPRPEVAKDRESLFHRQSKKKNNTAVRNQYFLNRDFAMIFPLPFSVIIK